MSDYDSILADAIADMEFDARGGKQVLWGLTINGVHYSAEYVDETNSSFKYVNDESDTDIAYLVDKNGKMHNPFEMTEDEFYDGIIGWHLYTVFDGRYLSVSEIKSAHIEFDSARGAL